MSVNDAQAEAPPLRGLTGSYSEAGGVELRGSAQALSILVEFLTSGDAAGVRRLEVEPGSSPEPYDVFLTAVRVVRVDGATRVGLAGTTLEFSGAQEGLRLLAENIAWVAEQSGPGSNAESSSHLHVEYYPGHPFLSPDSEPLVVALGP